MKTPVKFELAKLLKEKGFDKRSEPYRYNKFGETTLLEGINAPTIAEVVMWLYEKHGIWIDVSLNQFSKPNDLQWMYSIVFTKDCTYSYSPKSYDSPTEAYDAAIEYVLNNLL
jgi:hypothetical protein